MVRQVHRAAWLIAAALMWAAPATAGDPDGACCLNNGACFNVTESECVENALGEYSGSETSCATVACPQAGACCREDGSCALVTVVGGADCWFGTYQGDDTDCNTACSPQDFACACDLDGNGLVGFDDLLSLWNSWGPCKIACPADVSADGQVGLNDLVMLIDEFGSACGG